jgi:hypothetical protein
LHSPFNSLAPLTTGGSADAQDGAGDIIFVGVDSTPPVSAYDGGIVLEANQRLWGEPFGLLVGVLRPRSRPPQVLRDKSSVDPSAQGHVNQCSSHRHNPSAVTPALLPQI